MLPLLLSYSVFFSLCVSSFGCFTFSPFYLPIPDFYANIPDLYAKIPCYVLSMCVTAHSARVGGRGPMGDVEASLASYYFLIRRVV